MRRIALTGGIATGKSHVRARLEALGAPTIDADAIAREVVAAGTPGLSAVVARFGPQVLASDGTLNRKALATIVFGDAAARRDLEGIIHPGVRSALDAWFAGLAATGAGLGIAVIPLLYETGRERDFDLVVVTACSLASQTARLMERDHLSADEAGRRIAAQFPQAEKTARADYVIDTNGSIEDTNQQVDRFWQTTSHQPLAPGH